MPLIVNSDGFAVECAAGDAGRWAASLSLRFRIRVIVGLENVLDSRLKQMSHLEG